MTRGRTMGGLKGLSQIHKKQDACWEIGWLEDERKHTADEIKGNV